MVKDSKGWSSSDGDVGNKVPGGAASELGRGAVDTASSTGEGGWSVACGRNVNVGAGG